jgi:hypothetical protein
MMEGLKVRAVLAAVVVAACSSDGGRQDTRFITCGDGGSCPSGYTCANDLCVRESSPLTVKNPTGRCTGGAGGARPGYSVPDPATVWLPDCKSPLSREYWRVYALTPHSAYILPRPDGAYQLTFVCRTDDHPLRPLVDRYRLCSPAATPEDVDVVNDMKLADALAITHFLHTQLLFEASESVPDAFVRPAPIPGDVLDACALHPDSSSAALASDCDLERQAVETGMDAFPDFSATAPEMAALLNELYGIGNCASTEGPRRVCAACGAADECADMQILCAPGCTTDADCGDLVCVQGACPVGAQCG